MIAMILAAGRGERLRPLTDHTPKPLIEAGKHRLIEYTILALVDAGVTDIVINYAHLGEQFPAKLGDGSQFGANIVYSPELEGGLETAGGIINALPLLGEEPFIIVNGDIWTDYPFKRLTEIKLDQSSSCHLIMVNNPQHNPNGDFAISSDNMLVLDGDSKYTYSGIGIYSPSMFKGYDVQRLALKPLLLEAMKYQTATAEYYNGQWSDIGTIERLEQLKQQLASD